MPAGESLCLTHNRARGTGGTGPGRPFGPESVPSATSAVLRCLLVAGPFPGLDPLSSGCPVPDSPCWTPQQLTPDRRDVNRVWSAASGAARPALFPPQPAAGPTLVPGVPERYD